MAISENIKKYRIERKLTQKELAKKANISVASVQLYEYGAKEPKLGTIRSIANALGVPVLHLILDDVEGYSIGQKLHSLRTEKGILREELSKMIGESIERIRNFEYGVEMPDFILASKIATSLGITLGDVCTTEEFFAETERQRKKQLDEWENAAKGLLNSQEGKTIIQAFNSFNDEGKKEMADRVSDMMSNPNYVKNPQMIPILRKDLIDYFWEAQKWNNPPSSD